MLVQDNVFGRARLHYGWWPSSGLYWSKGLLTLFFSEAAPETLRTDMAAIQAIIEAVTASLRVRAQKA